MKHSKTYHPVVKLLLGTANRLDVKLLHVYTLDFAVPELQIAFEKDRLVYEMTIPYMSLNNAITALDKQTAEQFCEAFFILTMNGQLV